MKYIDRERTAEKRSMTMSRTNWIRLILVAILILIALFAIRLRVAAAQGLTPDLSGDPAAGHRLAAAWCSECHAIEGTARRGRTGATFTAIAKRHGTTALSLNAFLRSNHNQMPNFIIARGDADDIVAYILSLKRK